MAPCVVTDVPSCLFWRVRRSAHIKDAYSEFYGGPLMSKYNISENKRKKNKQKKTTAFQKMLQYRKDISDILSDNNNISGNIHFALKCYHLF